MVLIIPIPPKDGLIREDFKEIQGRDQLKNRYYQFIGLYSDQCELPTSEKDFFTGVTCDLFAIMNCLIVPLQVASYRK